MAVLAFYLLQTLMGGPQESMLRLGAVQHHLVLDDGQWFRLLCATFLHGHLLHLLLNGLALIQLAPLVEMLWGSHRMVAVYLASGLGCSLLSALLQPIPSVGASGAILGLAGLLIGATWIARDPFRSRLRQVLGNRLLIGVLLTFALGIGLQVFYSPIIDNWGHLGGFLIGLLSSAFLREPSAPPGRAARGLAGALVALCLGSFAWMAVTPLPDASLDRDMAYHALLQQKAPGAAKSGQVSLALASDLSAAGRVDDARAVLLTRLRAAPDDVAALSVLARSFRLHGVAAPEALAAARVLADRNLARHDELERRTRSDLLFTAAELHALAGDARAARAAEEELLVLAEAWVAEEPDDPTALNALAWSLVARHDPSLRDPARAERLARSAIDALERSVWRFSLEGQHDLAMTRDTLAEALRQLGRLQDAQAFQRRAIDMARELGVSGDALLDLTRRLEQIEAALRQAP